MFQNIRQAVQVRYAQIPDHAVVSLTVAVACLAFGTIGALWSRWAANGAGAGLEGLAIAGAVYLAIWFCVVLVRGVFGGSAAASTVLESETLNILEFPARCHRPRAARTIPSLRLPSRERGMDSYPA